MLYFNSDYTEGAHPKILEQLQETNFRQTVGYGEDEYCEKARGLIREACGAPEAGVHFLVGGTQANFTVIRAALRPHQGVISPVTGHIHVHETGAVEATGHKVLALPCGAEGKLSAGQVAEACAEHFAGSMPPEHMVQPKMVYLSHPTENGALYTKAELMAIRQVCDEYGLYLFVDGARMGYGLAARGTDVALTDLAQLCDVFYIGGTKCGALFGEAVVIPNRELNRDFRYAIKQNGGMLAKGRLLGLQFLTLFTDGLYTQICKKADEQAYRIAAACEEAGIETYAPSPTNQQFFIFPDAQLKKLEEKYVFSFWEKVDEGRTAVRICTSWATREEAVEELIADLKNLG